LQLLSSLSRIFISMLSGIIVYALIQSDFLLGFLKKEGNNQIIYIYYVLAVVSGFSETFIPDVLGGVEKKATKADGKS
ncbi:MAG TPA: hypothetical protein VLD19_11820, partial [Chitinophagaceae bacterium]|nr:hypothetical protein [Chitinophagaceae bacterium]